MAFKYLICLVLASLILSVTSMAKNPVINPQNMKKIFEAAKPYSDLSNAFYSIKGLNILGENAINAQNAKEVCEFTMAKLDKHSLESIYYAVSLASLIPNCQIDSTFQQTLDKGDSSTNVADLYYYVLTSKALNKKFDSKKVAKSLTDALKSDSSMLNQGYSLHIAALLSENNKVFYDSIEDVLDQADEVNKVFLQYEGGVGTTSIVLEGVFDLSEKFNKFPAKFDQATLGKFVNYLVSKRFPTNLKSAYFLLKTANKLCDNKLAVPLILNRLSPVSVTPAESNLLVSLTNLLGTKPNTQIALEALSAKNSKGNGLFTGKKTFTAKSSDSTSFDVKLLTEPKPTGFYAVNVGLNGPKHFFLLQSQVEVKVTVSVSVEDVQLAVSDRDATKPVFQKYGPKPLSHKADKQTKFTLKFNIKEHEKKTLVEAHQAFVKFTESKSGREIIFLAEAGLSKEYIVDIDFSTNAKNFRYQSGEYHVDLIVSDALFDNAVSLRVSELSVKLTNEMPAAQEKSSLYEKKPEIKHMFREAESRPAASISVLFAFLCFVPLGLMVVSWMSIGFNLSKFEFSLTAILFHLSLAAVFGLFYCYWIKLNMFTTLRYLSVIGFVLLVTGNKLLKSLASKKEKSN